MIMILEMSNDETTNLTTTASVVVDETSLTKKVRKEMDIGLMPSCIGMEESAVTKLLKKRRHQYFPELNGIVLRFGRLEFLEETGKIIDDMPLIYWKVVTDLTVFSVSPGCLISSQISRLSKQYIGCLLVNCIDVTIRFEEEHRELIETELVADGKLTVGDDIIFKVVAFKPSQKYIDGVIDSEVLRHIGLIQ